MFGTMKVAALSAVLSMGLVAAASEATQAPAVGSAKLYADRLPQEGAVAPRGGGTVTLGEAGGPNTTALVRVPLTHLAGR